MAAGFCLVTCRGTDLSDRIILGYAKTMGEIRNLRAVSGDLVCEWTPEGLQVSQSDAWLFPWEKLNPTCFARRMQAASKPTPAQASFPWPGLQDR